MSEGIDKEPDFIYDPADWEVTYPMDLLSELEEAEPLEEGEIREYATLFKGPPRFSVEVPYGVDSEGDPLGWERKWFKTREEAQAALGKATDVDQEKGDRS